jgi:hypothetical protein
VETRRLWVSAVPEDTDWPYAQQVFRVARQVTNLDGTKPRTEVVHGVTSLPPERADAARLLSLNRGHWAIENRVHWVRDVTFDEDRSQVRKRNGAHMMASLRNLAISVLRLAGATNVAAALRHCMLKPQHTLRLIGLC